MQEFQAEVSDGIIRAGKRNFRGAGGNGFIVVVIAIRPPRDVGDDEAISGLTWVIGLVREAIRDGRRPGS